VNETIRIEEPNMLTRPFDRILLASAVLALFSSAANAVTPTLQFTAGPLASVPITTGSLSVGGVTVEGVPIVGSIEEPELQVNGSVSAGGLFNPIESTEYNLGGGSGAASFTASISGTLEPLTSLDWSVYYDPANEPFGETTLLASRNVANPSSITSVGFFVPPVTASGPIAGPFSLTEVLSIGGPSGEQVSFNSLIVAKVPEAPTWAMMLLGFAGCGLILRQAKRRQAARV
jgi:hypothetical protein